MKMFSIQEFCQQFRISRALLYKLLRDGKGPRTIKIGRRTLISTQAAEDWQRGLEDARRAA